ncbi:MAG: hypothetical protein ACYC8T_02810 [Myxococcaceae bacterium]
MRRAVILALPCLWLLSCGQVQSAGPYLLTLQRVVKDECNLAQEPAVGRLNLTVAGNKVHGDYALFGLRLEGSFLASSIFTSAEGFSMDGTVANVTTQVNGQECLLELVTVRLEGTTRSADSFEGNLSVRLDTRKPESCVCELWATYQASRAAP